MRSIANLALIALMSGLLVRCVSAQRTTVDIDRIVTNGSLNII